jgi:microcystin degradation protein MlrC
MRILIADCEQEISSFNPVPSSFDDYRVKRGQEMFDDRGLNTQMGGALSVFEAESDVELVPTFSGRAPSTGPLSAAGWNQLSGEILDSIRKANKDIDAIYFSLHGAMGARRRARPGGLAAAGRPAASWARRCRWSSRSTCTASSPTGCSSR